MMYKRYCLFDINTDINPTYRWGEKLTKTKKRLYCDERILVRSEEGHPPALVAPSLLQTGRRGRVLCVLIAELPAVSPLE